MLDSLEKKKLKRCHSESWYLLSLSVSHYLRLPRDEDWLWLLIHTDWIRSAPVCYYMCRAISETHLLVNTSVNLKRWHILSKLFSHNHLLQNSLQALWVLSTFSPAICHFNSITNPSLFPCLSPTMWNSWECEQSSLEVPQKICLFAHFICYRVSKDLLIHEINVYKHLFCGPTI